MARLTLDVSIDFDHILCHDEGDGCGNAEPFLWTVFFRIGGDDVSIVVDGIDFSANPPKPIIHLAGSPSMHFSLGSHGNLSSNDVSAGQTVIIPDSVGLFETTLKPIAMPQALKDLGALAGVAVPDDIPGYVGAAVILMEEDNISDAGIEAGHMGLNQAVTSAIQNIINTRSYDAQNVSEQDINSLTSGISDAVINAVKNQQSWWQNIWSLLNADDQIGYHSYLFSTDELTSNPTRNLSQRWKNEGDWEIFGELQTAPVCPADAVGQILGALFGDSKKFAYDRESLVKFRDQEFMKHHGAFLWWEKVIQHKLQIVSTIRSNPKALILIRDLFISAQKFAKNPEKKIATEDIQKALKFLTIMGKSRKRETRIDACRAKDFVSKFEGKTVRDVLKVMNVHSPRRHHREKIGQINIKRS